MTPPERAVDAPSGPDAGPVPAVRRLADWDAERLRGLAAEYGTPLYVLDVDRALANVRRLRGAFERPDRSLSVDYAVKANAAGPLLAALADAGVGAECASAAEVERALDAGIPAERVRYTAVNPPARDLDAVCELVAADGGDGNGRGDGDEHDGLSITVGARDTVDRLAERGYDGPLFVRVDPGVGAGHHEAVAVGDDPTFGVPPDVAVDLLGTAADLGMDPVGVHAHLGSGVSDDPEDLAAYRGLVERLAGVAADAPVDVSTVATGGGFGVPYHPDEPPVDLDAVADVVHDALAGCDADLSIEPGRSVVADAGVLLTHVNTVQERSSTVVAGVDAGMTTLARPALYDAYHSIRSLAPDAADRERVGVTATGPVCESADALCRNRSLPHPARGDVLAVGNAGAYGYAMASTYNGRPRPATVALVEGDPGVARRRETVADLRRLEASRDAADATPTEVDRR